MKIAEAFVELRSDDTKAKAEVQKQAKGLGGQFAQIFGAAAFGAGLKKSIDAASDLNETVSKTRVIFGGASGEIEKFAATAATSMGMSKKAYLDAASGLKGLLTNLGLADDQSTKYAQSLTGLGADLASFFNTDPADAIDAISAALRGEAEPIRRYNVNINDAAVKTKAFEMGLYSGKGAIDASAKAQATLALITDQTASAQGDFARTADGVANSQRIAKAELENSAASLGQNFLPVYQRVTEVVGFLAEKFGALPASVQVGFVALAAVVALSGPLSKTVDLAKGIAKGFEGMSSGAKSAAGAAAMLGAALIALDAINKLTANAAGATDAMNEFIVATDKASFVTDEGIVTLANSFTKLAVEQGKAQGSISKTFDVLKAGAQDGNVQMNLLGNQMRETFDALLDADPNKAFDVAMALDEVRRSADNGNKSARETLTTYGLTNEMIDEFVRRAELAAEAQATLKNKTEDTTKATDGQAVSLAHLVRATDRATSATEGTRAKFEDAATAADDLKKAIESVFGPSMDLEEANRNLQQGAADLVQSLKDNGTTLDINTDKGRANRAAIEDQVKGILDFSVALVNNGASAQDAANATAMLTQQLHDQLKAAGLTEEQIASYLDTLGLTPENVTTTIELAEADKRKRELGDLLGQLGDIDAGAKAEIQADIDQGHFDTAQSKIDALAKDRGVVLKVSLTGGGTVDINTIGSKIYVKAHAQGAYISGPELATLGEGGRPEAVLPLTNRRRMAALLGDPRIGGPVMEALGSHAGGVAVAAPTVVHNHSHTWQIWGTERSYVADLMRKFEIQASGG